MQRGPLSDPPDYLARIIRYMAEGTEQVTVLPGRSVGIARLEESERAPGLFDGHHVGGYRSEPRNGRVRVVKAQDG